MPPKSRGMPSEGKLSTVALTVSPWTRWRGPSPKKSGPASQTSALITGSLIPPPDAAVTSSVMMCALLAEPETSQARNSGEETSLAAPFSGGPQPVSTLFTGMRETR